METKYNVLRFTFLSIPSFVVVVVVVAAAAAAKLCARRFLIWNEQGSFQIRPSVPGVSHYTDIFCKNNTWVYLIAPQCKLWQQK
jgi:hypothetical protein